MAKKWANKDKYHPSNGVLEPRVHMLRAKAIVRTVPTWGDRKVAGRAASWATPIRPVTSAHHRSDRCRLGQIGFCFPCS
jgi:hypothetical protein